MTRAFLPIAVFASLLSMPAIAVPVDDKTALRMVVPEQRIVDASLSPAAAAALEPPADAFYGFWTNGSPALLARAVSPRFVDHMLPLGRTQGPADPAEASRAFLAAMPDLRVAVLQRLVVGDRVVSLLRFTGHFTGQLDGRSGAGQPVNFIATDILRIRDNHVTDNWHQEDNLAFLRQAGALPVARR